ncbi:MAG: DUF4317 domain-containing protein [Oscillospiraceae bacterium]|jgi:hypothetical protein
MNEKEIAEIRRRFRPDKSNISHVRGCYVNSNREIISQFSQSLALTPQEEAEKILALLKRSLSGTLGKNLIDVTFTTQQVVDSDEHRLLMTLRNSALNDEEAVQTFYQRVIQALSLEGQYMILLAQDTYDVPYRSKDGESLEDASSEVFSYILCSICPVKMTQPALSYFASDNQLHNRTADWIVSAPELGFLFPAFDDRSANIYNALYYSRNTAENHQELVEALFNTEIPMPAADQKETFEAILETTLERDCSYDVVQTVHEQLYELIEEHKANKEAEPPVVSKRDMKQVLQGCGISEQRVTVFEEKYDAAFGPDTGLSPRNLVDSKFQVKTPDVTIQVNPERSDLIETRVINGAKYILIRAEDGVEVNGVDIHIAP